MRFRTLLVLLAIVCSFGIESRAQTSGLAVRYYEAGQKKLDGPDWLGAVEDFTKAIELNARSSRAKLQNKQQTSEQTFDRPHSDSSEIAVSDSFTAYAYINRGVARFYLRDFDAAVADYERALRIKPKLAEAYLGRGAARKAKGDHDGALLDFQRALAINEKLAEAYNNRGHVLLEKKDFAGAIEDFDRAIELKPTLETAHYGRGTSFMKQGRFDLAVRDLTSALKLNPGLAEAYGNRGLALIVLGKEKEALTDLQKCVELNPELRTTLEAKIQSAKELMRVNAARLNF